MQLGLLLYTIITFIPVILAVTKLHVKRGTCATAITDMRRLTIGICSEKCVVRRSRRCANVYLHKPRL
jgi:hypothetical protein